MGKKIDNGKDGSGVESGGISKGDVGGHILEEFKSFLKAKAGLELVATDVVLEAIIQKGFESLGAETKIYVSDILKAIELQQKLGQRDGEGIQEKINKLLNAKPVGEGTKGSNG